MCTVSFIARKRGYVLAMNRDEKFTRPKGLPPKVVRVDGHKVIYPSEPSGGTWISLNDTGVTYALINWYSVRAEAGQNSVSRGIIVKSVCPQTSPSGVFEILKQLPLEKFNPFRLIGVFPKNRQIFEWCWDLKNLVCRRRRWREQQFISSGLDEPKAQRIRHQTFRIAARQKTAGSLQWLRRLHCSHWPNYGPFSTCMHRADAATVSYAEVMVSAAVKKLKYRADAPCLNSKFISIKI
jgi:hypothetical protein